MMGWLAMMTPAVGPFLGAIGGFLAKAFKVISDNRAIQIACLIGLILFIDWRGDVSDRKRAEKFLDMQNQVTELQANYAIATKEIKALVATGKIVEKRQQAASVDAAAVGAIINDIENTQDGEDGTLAPVTRSTNTRINCLLHPGTCSAED